VTKNITTKLQIKYNAGCLQSDKDVDQIIQKCYQETVEELVKMGTDLMNDEGKNKKLVRKIDETFFKNSLEKNKTYFWEKAIFYSMNNLIKN
jgi:Tat protein secretion system quality control protein TatD with DNase activity